MLSLSAILALLTSKAALSLLGMAIGWATNAWTSRMRDVDAQNNAKALGGAVAAAAANKEAADAEARMSEANAQHRDAQTVVDRLGQGTA